MNIKGISFIGVDERTDYDKMLRLQELTDIPLEFGVLYSPSKNGKANRYPSEGFVEKFGTKYANENLSLHLCGTSVDDFFNNPKDKRLYENYKRIQLNFSINTYKTWDVTTKTNDYFDLTHKLAFAVFTANRPLIVQYNKSKKEFVDGYIANSWHVVDNLHVLFDASGGFGKTLTTASKAINGVYCGYAGGINPNTVQDIVKSIVKVNGAETPFYIDMESGVRDEDDWFSLDACEEIIEKVNELRHYDLKSYD